MTPTDATTELRLALANNDGWGDGYVLVRRDALATHLELTEGES